MKTLALIAALVSGLTLASVAQDKKKPGYQDTPQITGQKWKVHDSERPHPAVVTPGEQPGAPPSDAIVLFDGKDLSKWKGPKGDAGWKVENGYMECVAKAGDVTTRDEFGDMQLHVEFATPSEVKGDSQGRGNSGVFLHGRYEVQVLDSYNNLTYPDGQASSLYGQWPPLVNVCRKPGEWQTYDIVFIAPRYKEGQIETPGRVTVLHNGVVTHNAKELLGPSAHRSVAKESPYSGKGPIRFQDHGNPMRFRNVWVRLLKSYDEQ